jgi:RNA polymerase sigma factor (TIGR02999 family)
VVGAVTSDAAGDVTRLLERAREGDSSALAQVLPLVYEELRRIAHGKMRRQGPAGTLQTTALVHEVYLRLVGRESPWESRAQFFGVAARAMRSILVDHARARKAAKRGGAVERECFHEALAWFEDRSIDVIALDEALDTLERDEPRQRRLVALRFFAGLSTEDAAAMLGVSTATAERDWTVARAWLKLQLAG